MEAINRVEVSYFSSKLLLTVDIQVLFQVMFEYFGDDVELHIRRMSPSESKESQTNIEGISVVRDRFTVRNSDGERLRNIEEEINRRGAK